MTTSTRCTVFTVRGLYSQRRDDVGSDGSAASGGASDLSEWQRSAGDAGICQGACRAPQQDIRPYGGTLRWWDTAGRVTRPLRVRQHPFFGIVVDVFPDLVVILLIADHMVVIGTLKNGHSNFLGRQNFYGTHNIGNLIFGADVGIRPYGLYRRGRCPHRPVVQSYNHVYMVWHNYVFFNFRGILNVFLHDFSVRFWDDVGIVPYDIA